MKRKNRESQDLGVSEGKIIISSASRWFVPLSRNYFFTGRDVNLCSLHENFHRSGDDAEARVQVICGAGGMGKTQLALEYAYRVRDEYTSVFWLRTETPETLLADLIALMNFFDLPQKQGCEHNQILSAVKHWLNQQSNWLLVLDNVEDFELVRELLPTSSVNHVLITTRQQGAFASEHRLNLQAWSAEDGTLFLLRRARLLSKAALLEAATDEQRMQATAIYEKLGGLPLAMDQAGAYLEETGCTLIGYQQRLQDRQELLLSRRGTESFAHPDPVTTTILLAVERVEREFPAAAELLRLLAFLASDAIPEELFVGQNAETLGEVLYSSTTNPFEMDTIYSTFNATSLVELNVQTRLLTIHRLVQAVILSHMDKETQQQWACRALQAVNQVFPSIDNESCSAAWSKADQLLPHALLMLTWADRILSAEVQAVIAPVISSLLLKVSVYLVTRGYYQKAQPLLERCISLLEQTVGAMHPSVAMPLTQLGRLFRIQGQYASAEALLQRSLSIYEQASLSLSPAPLTVLGNLAMLALERGQYEQAELFMKRLISIEEQLQGVEERVPSLEDLATIYSRQGRYEEAKALLLHTVRLYEQTFGSEHPNLLAVLNNLANFYTEQGLYAEAQPLYQRALHVLEHSQGVDNARVATVLCNLGEVSRKQEHYEESESHYMHALSLWEQTVGSGHLRTAYAFHGLAMLRMAQGQYKEAEQFFRETIRIREHAYDEVNADMAEVFHDLACLYSKQGKDDAALPLFERGLQIREQVLGPMHPVVATSLYHLGHLYARQGRTEKARSCFQRVLALREQVLGKRHPETLLIRSDLETLERRQASGPTFDKRSGLETLGTGQAPFEKRSGLEARG